MIRIIGGKYKGKRLKRVSSEQVRPMPDKLKESLMSILQSRVRGSLFLDGFSGTGSVGIEALSRGASFVVFVDSFLPSVNVININLKRCAAEAQARVLHKEFNRAVIQLARDNMKFDLVFLDPPYRLLEQRNPLKVIHKRYILQEKGMIVLRHHFKTDFKSKYFKRDRDVRIGDDVLTFFQQENRPQ
jgi:16S rRNA (guanine966-N2)-methyltransferase